jgi:hypothetical protein
MHKLNSCRCVVWSCLFLACRGCIGCCAVGKIDCIPWNHSHHHHVCLFVRLFSLYLIVLSFLFCLASKLLLLFVATASGFTHLRQDCSCRIESLPTILTGMRSTILSLKLVSAIATALFYMVTCCGWFFTV